MPKLTSRREFFRLPYPVTTGATLAIDGTNYTVGEISEGGLRLICSGDKFPVAQRVQGTLTLTAGMRCTVIGTVLRVEDRCVIVKLSRGPDQLRRVPRTAPPDEELPGLETPAGLSAFGRSV